MSVSTRSLGGRDCNSIIVNKRSLRGRNRDSMSVSTRSLKGRGLGQYIRYVITSSLGKRGLGQHKCQYKVTRREEYVGQHGCLIFY